MNPSSARAQEIRSEATKWSLDGDAKLLDYMREISRNLELRCRETELKINRMCLSGEEANVELGNATNRLLALQHAQFVENRVQEDEEVAGGADSGVQGVPEVRQMSPMSTLKSILADSVVCLNNCYEKIEVDLEEDSDEEDEPGRSVAFRPRDPYVHRPLPFVIGSKEFKEKWHVGLVDSESDSANEEEAQFSDSSESGQSVSLPSAGGSEADSVWGLQTTSNALAHKSASQVSSEDEPSSRDRPEVFQPVPAQRAYFQPPKLTPRQNPPDPVGNLFSSSPPAVPTPTSKPPGLFDDLEDDDFDAPAPKATAKPPPFFREAPESVKTVNLFDDEPPEFEIPPPKTQKSRPSGLFLDSEDEEEQPAKKTEAPANLFPSEEPPADDEFDSFMSSLKAPGLAGQVAKPKLSNLFDDDDEPEDFLDTLLKGAKSKPQPAKREEPKAAKRTSKSKKISLFEDSEEEDMFAGAGKKTEHSKRRESQEKEIPKEIVKEAPKKISKETPKEILKEIPNEISKEIPKKTQKETLKENSIESPKETSKNISNESQKEVSKEKSKETAKEIVKETSKDIPEKTPKETAKETSKVTPKETKTPLFVEEEPPPDEDKIPDKQTLEEVIKNEEPLTEQIKSPPEDENQEINIQKPPQNSANLFVDEGKSSSNDLFGAESAETEDWLEASPSFQTPSNLFNEPPEDEVSKMKESKLPGLFDDLDDGDDDFFVAKVQPEKPQKPASMPLFDDLPPDDDLFVDRKEVFYDDFAESFPPEVTSVNPTANSYLFNDEPPVDDWLAEERKSRSSSRDEPDEIFSNVRNLIKSHEKPEVAPEEPLNKPKIVPNKLNKTMTINVAALLPGAKRPSFKTAPESPPEDKVMEEKSEVKPEEVEKPEDPSLLANLNRNRARVPQKRKPSTRRGRQEIYRKSLILENDSAESGENTHNNSLPEKSEESNKLADDLFGDGVNETEPKAPEKTGGKIVKSTSKSLFDSDDDDDSDIFATRKSKNLPKSTSEPTKITAKATSLFGDSEEDDDDLFGASSKMNSVKIAPISKVEKKIAKKSAVGDDPLADLF